MGPTWSGLPDKLACWAPAFAVCFLQDPDFPSLSGARVVRIAVHPQLSGAGYGSRALDQLKRFFQVSDTKQESGSRIWSLVRFVQAFVGAVAAQHHSIATLTFVVLPDWHLWVDAGLIP